MNREERLQDLAKRYYRIDQREKNWKSRRESLREEIIRLIEYDFRGKDRLLPVKTIEVPDVFFKTTGMSKEEFAATRFPGWDVEHCEYNIAEEMTTFVLKRDPSYLPRVVESDDVRVSKVITEYSPVIDWDSLEKERPDLHDKLVRRVEVKELDDAALERLVHEQPEELATLERHLRVKSPVVKIQPTKVKNGRERLK